MEKAYFDVRSVEEILDSNSRASRTDTYGTRTIIFTMLSKEQLNEELRSKYILSTVYTGAFLGFVALLIIWSQFDSIVLRAGSAAALASLAAFTWKTYQTDREKLAALAMTLREPLQTLDRIRDGLVAYQEELNRRTKDYLHLVTHEKVNAYFVLHQLTAALEKRIRLVEEVLSPVSRERIDTARELLQKDLSFRDGATSDTGTLRRVNLSFLNEIAEELMHNLNTGIARLEKDLKSDRELISEGKDRTRSDVVS